MPSNFIADGYTQPGYIQPVERLYDAMRFRFRPVLTEERSRLTEAATTSAGFLRQMAALVAEKLVEWDIRDPLGNDVEISPAHVLRLQPELLVKLQQIVLGAVASDLDPDWADEQINRLADEELAASTVGCTIGEARQQESEKN